MSRFLLVVLVLMGVLLPLINALYAVGYVPSNQGESMRVTGGPFVFREAPNALHVADLVARLNGHPPLLREEHVNLPSAASVDHDAILLELQGGVLPQEAQSVFKGSVFPNGVRGPALEQVMSELATRGISMKSVQMKAGGEHAAAVSEFLKAQGKPVIVLHHENAGDASVSRQLSVGAHRQLTNITSAPLSEFQISQYQICAWTGFVMIILLGAAICSVGNMEVVPDNILYAKFQSTRANKSD